MYSVMAFFKSTVAWGLFEYCNHQLHRDFLITLYYIFYRSKVSIVRMSNSLIKPVYNFRDFCSRKIIALHINGMLHIERSVDKSGKGWEIGIFGERHMINGR
jgi:hypothetical protein